MAMLSAFSNRQWGMYETSTTDNIWVTLPLAYSNSSYRLLAQAVDAANNSPTYVKAQQPQRVCINYGHIGIGVAWISVGN